MSRALAVVAAVVALVAPTASAAPPRHGTLVPGRSLGGLRLGETQSQVEARWGKGHGVCTRCSRPTWYFTYRPFTQQGIGVEFGAGRIVAIYTLWEPPGWHTSSGAAIGMPKWRLPQLAPQQCRGYLALSRFDRKAAVVTTYYVLGGRIWGFALQRPGEPLCR
jgi:hypothetical protein